MKPETNPDYAEVQAIIWEHMQYLLDRILEEEKPDAYTPSHSGTSR